MPRRPKLRYSHSQGQGSERYFKNRAGVPVEMIDLFGFRSDRSKNKGSKGIAGKTKMGSLDWRGQQNTWSLTKLFKITRGKK